MPPHPQVNRKDTDTLDDAFAYLNGISQNRRLWTILKFNEPDSKFHVFYSTQTFSQQMFSISRTIFEYSGHYGRGLPHGRGLAHDMTNTLVLNQVGQPHAWGGHSEEHMIQQFNHCKSLCGGTPTTALIWNSDSPCRTHDRNPSANLRGWPSSCAAKLRHLAAMNGQITFIVYIRKAFGALAGQTPSAAASTIQAESGAPNIRYLGFTTELSWMIRQYPNLDG